MKSQEQDLIQTLLAIVGLAGAYALLTLGLLRDLTTVEVAILLQTLCISCGVAGLLVVLRRYVQR